MFKIESYLTSLILNHVAQFVEDFRQQDAQLSLWQGEVQLKNLNMRLDVLQQVLQLPFELISGHIHELNILVPWTKIMSEPIKVTINTIEFVLKMKKESDEESRSSDPAVTTSTKKQEELQQEQGGLVNKILKNIEVNCHNIILKLVVEDIVLSMNVQLLSFSSADENWAPAMVDVNQVKVVLRKLVKISDLTICLDKRNEAGQIEVCQEPVLYRCNLECRILDKYNVRTKAKCSTKRIGVYTELLDINISSLQFPMMLRLCEALCTLGVSKMPDTTEKNDEEFFDSESITGVNQSYFSRVWNLLPNFEFFEGDDPDADLQKGHTKDMGVYIEHLNVTLKACEFISDGLMSTSKRLRYTPIVRLSLGGMYLEKVSAEELGWSSLKSGLTTVVIEPLGPYFNEEVASTNALLECSSAFEIGNSFFDKSIFDKRCLIADKGWGVTNYEEYSNRITDEYLLYRTPVLAFDLVEYKITNRDDSEPTTSDSSADKRIQYRLLSSGVTFRYNQVFLEITNIINDYVKSYDYAEGALDKNDSLPKLHPPRKEDIDAFMKNIPLCTYKFKLKNINLEIHTFMGLYVEGKSKPMARWRLPNDIRKTMKYVLVQLEHVEGQLTRPLEPDKLLVTTSQLPKKNLENLAPLLDACYDNYIVNANNLQISLTNPGSNSLSKIVIVPTINCQYSSIIMPKLWFAKKYVPLHTVKVQCEQFDVEFSRQELTTIFRMLNCIQEYKPQLIWILKKQESNQPLNKETIKLHNKFTQLQGRLSKYKYYSIWNISTKSLMTETVYQSKGYEKKYELLNATSNDKWLEVQAQLPTNSDDMESNNKVVFALWIEKFSVSVDKHLLKFLKYPELQEAHISVPPSTESIPPPLGSSATLLVSETLANTLGQSVSQQSKRQSSLPSVRNERKISQPAESVRFGPEPDDKTRGTENKSADAQQDSSELISMERLRFLKVFVTHIEVAQSELRFGEDLSQLQKAFEYTKIQIPHTVIESAEANQIARSDMNRIIDFSIPADKNTFNWTVNMSGIRMQNHTPSMVYDILMPIGTKISVAVMHQTEVIAKTVSKSRRSRGSRASRASVASERLSTRASTLSRDVEIGMESSSESELSLEEIEDLPFNQDKVVQLSRSCESISLNLYPSLDNMPSAISVASSVRFDTRPSVDMVGRVGSSVSMDTRNEKLSMASLGPNKKDVISLSLHADTTPIHFIFSVNKIKTLIRNFKFLTRIYNSLKPASYAITEPKNNSIIEIVTLLEEHADIKDFLELETHSRARSTIRDPLSQQASFTVTSSFLCQWTITKIIFELVNSNEDHPVNASKCLLEFEDLLSTVDKRTNYTKYTGKVGQFSLTYKDLNPSKEWISNERLRIKILPGSGNALPFLNVIITSVSSKDFHTRIGAKRKNFDANQHLYEICLSIEAMEIILDFEQLAKYVKPLCPLWISDNRPIQQTRDKNPLKSQFLTSANLPMIHLDSKGFVLYLPVKSGKETCTVLILMIQNIGITPSLQNPLQRTLIRADVFAKASAMGIINTPGSIVEDRQYELTLKNICLLSGDFDAILAHMLDQSTNFLHTNPAFEWNNTDRRSTHLIPMEIFNNFTFICIFAPCILYKNVLICGQAIEFNCASELIASINTHELSLILCLILQLIKISEIINSSSCSSSMVVQRETSSFISARGSLEMEKLPSVSSSNDSYKSCDNLQRQSSLDKRRGLFNDPQSAPGSNIFSTIDENNEQNITHKSDSGFYSCLSTNGNIRLNSSERFRTITSSSSVLQQVSASSVQRKVPTTVSLIAGQFLIQIFDVIQTNKSLPLISLTISEPSFMISQNIYDLSMQMTLFGVSVNIASGDLMVRRRTSRPSETTTEERDDEAIINLFPYNLLTTKQGTLGVTGIPPPLFSCKMHLSKKQLLEINIEISKPLVLTMSEEYSELLVKDFKLINQVLLENSCFGVCSTKPIVRQSKNELMRLYFFNADRFHCKLDWLEITFLNDKNHNCSLIFVDAKANVKFLSHPEKANGKLSISNIHIKANDKVVLHPMGLRASVDFVTEPWYSLPLVSANVRFNVVQIDVGVHELLQLRRALTKYIRISGLFLEEWQKLLRKVPNENRETQKQNNSLTRDNLVPIKCPIVPNDQNQSNQNKKIKQREEFYQDDLRAGAFQFVEMATDSLLPLPYQILIIKKNFGIICWRYPQPRRMSKIQIFPVPMAVPNPIHINCRMEYFSETYEGFLHFCDFWLSETVSKELELPQRPICANIWRVVIMQSLVSVNKNCFDQSDDDEEVRSITTVKTNVQNEHEDSKFILDPKLLVGCMRIDSSFHSDSVPKVQLLISFNILKVNILNHPAADAELPDFLEGYKLAPTTQISQTFLSLNVERMNWFLSLPSSMEYNLNVDMTFSIKCIDYGFLNMVYLLEKSSLSSFFHLNKENNSVMVDVVHDKIRVNFGPTILHTLLSAKKHWEESWSVANKQSKSHHTFIPKFVIVNQTFSVVSFGQTGSTERILLQPKEVHMYSFRSHLFKQELTFFIADNQSLKTEASQSVPISLKFECNVMLQNIRIGNKCLIIKSQKLSATQIYVLIKGQFELISMVPHELHLQIRREGKRYNEQNTLEYPIQPMSRCSFFRSGQNNENIFMRLRFMNGTAKGRSGDIPLRPNKHLPWLVKVPHRNNNFISFWVRVLREDIPDFIAEEFQPQRVLITIWPIFEICSMLTRSISAQETSSTEEFVVEPKGGRYLLDVPATHLTEHYIKFNYKFPVDSKVNTDYRLSLTTIDWSEFFWYDEQKWKIEYALQELPAKKRINWPLNDTEELRLMRMSRTEDICTINYNCTPSRDFSCSLCLKVSAWGFFINATGLIISVCDYETKRRLLVESNGIEMMLAIDTAFTLDIRAGKEWTASLPIYFKETSSTAKEKFYVALEDISSEIVILCGAEVVKFVLEFRIEEERKIFILRSKYNVINFTKIDLCVLPFALDHKESSTKCDIKRLDGEVHKKNIPSVKTSPDCIGQTLDSFFDLQARKFALRTSDSAFVSFVCFKLSDDSEFSIPIPLTMQFTRKCFSLQNGAESIPLVATLIEQNGIFYLSIFDDPSPAILLNNHTEIKLVVAQTNAAENSKVSSPTPEYDGKHFVWNQLVAPFSKCYYTPPEMYVNFPDVESTKCNLTLALWKENIGKAHIHWSKPLRTDKSWEKYLHVPNHGDVKVTICVKHDITRVSIYYISQQTEFCVKDLRSRLLLPAMPSQPNILDPSSVNPSRTSITSFLSVDTNTTELTSKANPPDICTHFRSLKTKGVNIKLRCFVKEINLNLNTDHKDRDYAKTNIFALYIDDCMLAYESNCCQRELNVLFANMQVDNQLFSSGNYDFPVVLCSQALYKHNPILPQLHFLDRLYDDLRRSQPMVAIGVSFFDDELKVSSLDCNISPIRAYIEDAYLNDLLDAIVEFVPSNCVYLPEDEPERLTLMTGQMLLPRKIAEQSICMAEPMKLKSFRIQPLNLLLSVHTSVRLYIALDHSPLSFSSYERRQINSVPLRFGQSVGMHYLSGAIFGAGWVVGSLEILGSPSGLARSFSTGLRDFVSMPVRGLLRGPWGFIIGITQGSASLLRNVTTGTVNSVTKLASSVARNLDRLSLDQDHIDRTEALRRLRPQGFTEGFSQGITGLGISLLGAVGGIARHTLEARTPGQVVTGVGKGLVGAVTKPLGGAAELLALTGQGVLQSVGFNTMPQQRMKPSENNVKLEPSEYRIWKLLPRISANDQILFYLEVTVKVKKELKQAYVLLTSEAFAIVEVKSEKLSLAVPIENVEMTIDPEDKTLVVLRITEKENEAEEGSSYTNERIMTFIRSSFLSIQSLQTTLKSDSHNEFFQKPENRTHLDWRFYINEHLGEYLLEYIKIIRRKYEDSCGERLSSSSPQ